MKNLACLLSLGWCFAAAAGGVEQELEMDNNITAYMFAEKHGIPVVEQSKDGEIKCLEAEFQISYKVVSYTPARWALSFKNGEGEVVDKELTSQKDQKDITWLNQLGRELGIGSKLVDEDRGILKKVMNFESRPDCLWTVSEGDVGDSQTK